MPQVAAVMTDHGAGDPAQHRAIHRFRSQQLRPRGQPRHQDQTDDDRVFHDCR